MVQEQEGSDRALRQAALTVARNIGRTRQTLAGTAQGELMLEAVDDHRLVGLHEAVVAVSQPWGLLVGEVALNDGAAERVAQD
jgi:hypothetical protein